ncbi:MAG TPA: M13 family metallopeptidase [Pyrinomonadaceae bacterium]|jgi:putative endopeptidase|nr:M13 family metallopeptidase [Pyrinomonadaceae bacterium]
MTNSQKSFVAFALLLAFSLTTVFGQSQRGYDPANMDKSAAACTDFYQYANGNWLNNTAIPGAYSSWGAFNILAEDNRKTLHDILEEAAKKTNAAKGSNEQKIGDYYASCLDEAKREAEGMKPLVPELARIDKIQNIKGVQAEIAYLHRHGVPTLFGYGSLPDLKNSAMVLGATGQGGLSLPNRDYYTKTDETSVKLRDEFVKHVATMFQLVGDSAEQAAKNAQAVLALQTRLAQNSRTPVELRDPTTQYHLMTPAQLKELTPNFSWADYRRDVGAPITGDINVTHPEFFTAVDKMFTEVPVADWKTYLRWHLITAAAPSLSSKFEIENFNFFGKTLEGRKEQLPRWRRCVSATDASLGEALGQVYVARSFTPESKARMQALVNNLIAAFREHLLKLDWMGDDTRKQAIVKLDAFKQKIGYPDKWIDYSRLSVSRESYLANVLRSSEFDQMRDFAKINKPVDRKEWGITPPTVNAGYNSLNNDITFPAGILKAPFFNPDADDAINYGAIGAVIGHEITHGYDDSGSNFDALGNLKNWWTESDRKNFDERADCVISQFSSFEAEPGLHLQGKLVSGESIADLGGLFVAYDAFMKSLQGKPRPVDIDGFSPEQRFFLGWAQVWAEKTTPEAARLQAQSDPHPLSRFRVNGPLSNMPKFAEAFQCKTGDDMVREESKRCQIW